VLTVQNLTQGTSFQAKAELTERERDLLLSGGLLNAIKTKQSQPATV
jgi:aconitate hydratase